MSEKKRLDVLLTERGLQESRQRAQAVIMSGEVFVNGQRVDKPGTAVAEDAQIEVRGGTLAYVSRGGLKLEKAMAAFPIDLNGAVCADIGASTGGFTDCMLQNGAEKVYAVDVGYGQLAWKLRSDPRVVCLERTNARYLTHEQVPDELDFASVDVSFISLKLILPPLNGLLKDGGHAACLVKPQFEAGREKVGKKGVVRDPAVHLEVLEHFLDHAGDAGFTVLGLTYSPIRGPEGNIEYLGYLEKGPRQERTFDLKALVDRLRLVSGGRPIGIKIAAGRIEKDLEFCVYAGPDFITIDGRGGATGASPKIIRDSTSVPTIYALYRARKYLDQAGCGAQLVITGGLRVSSDFAKALAMGADAVAIASAALMAAACQQYRICGTGMCPVGVATQDEKLRSRFKEDAAAQRVANFLRVSLEEIKTFARITGHDNIHDMDADDLCTVSREISEFTNIRHA